MAKVSKKPATTASADAVLVGEKGVKPLAAGTKLERVDGFWGGRTSPAHPQGQTVSKRSDGKKKDGHHIGPKKAPKTGTHPVGECLAKRKDGKWYAPPPPTDDE